MIGGLRHFGGWRRGHDGLPAVAGDHVGVVGQIHLAGYTDTGSYLFDTHSAPVADAVWELYAHAVRRLGEVSTLIEWDAEIPPMARLCEEVDRARAVARAAASSEGGGIAEPGRPPALARFADPGA